MFRKKYNLQLEREELFQLTLLNNKAGDHSVLNNSTLYTATTLFLDY